MKYIPILLILIACQPKNNEQAVEIQEVRLGGIEEDGFPKMLSKWDLFEGYLSELNPSENVFPYEINSPLFSDYALKKRFIQLPEGEKMVYNESEVFDFPVGTILVKNFYYLTESDQRILETRLLIKEERKWEAIVYEWNAEQTDAKRVILGSKVEVEWADENGKLQRVNYNIPSQPQCKSCHDLGGKLTPIGPSARQLNKDGQLQSWSLKNRIDLPQGELVSLVDYSNKNELLVDRARAWLEVNCAHCHRKEGPAKNTGLYLLASETDPYKIGVNKPPVAAGRGSAGLKYSIVAGEPDKSILVHRIETLEPGEMMPELGRTLRHEEGIQLVREWIEKMK